MMYALHKYLVIIVTIIVFPTPAMAIENQNHGCDNGTIVDLGRMGAVNEGILQQHIDKIKQQLKKIHVTSGSFADRKRQLRRHLLDMQAVTQELHNQKYANSCKDPLSGASIEIRVVAMEKRVDMIQQMMEQMIEHFLVDVE